MPSIIEPVIVIGYHKGTNIISCEIQIEEDGSSRIVLYDKEDKEITDYNLLKIPSPFKPDDEVVFVRHNSGILTYGKVYIVQGVDCDEIVVICDLGNRTYRSSSEFRSIGEGKELKRV